MSEGKGEFERFQNATPPTQRVSKLGSVEEPDAVLRDSHRYEIGAAIPANLEQDRLA